MRLLLLTFLVALAFGCASNPPERIVTTPMGVKLRGISLTDTQKARIDSQITKLNGIAQRYNYSSLPHSEYTIEVVNSSPDCDDPFAILIKGWCDGDNCYDGTQWDKNPEKGAYTICASGQYHESTNSIEVTQASIEATEIVRYECEHQLLRFKDAGLYLKTRIHSDTNYHPILCDTNETCSQR